MLAGIASYLRRHHVALLALFLALGGTSLAAASFINGKQIKPGSIPKNRLTASAIRSLKGNKARRAWRVSVVRPESRARLALRRRSCGRSC